MMQPGQDGRAERYVVLGLGAHPLRGPNFLEYP